jgi:citrate synthase
MTQVSPEHPQPAIVPGVVKGMKGVIACESSLSFIDGAVGKLIYRGYSIEDLAHHASFEEVAYLLWYDKLPTKTELAELRARLVAEMSLPGEVVDAIRALPKTMAPIAAMRTIVSLLAGYDPDPDNIEEADNLRKAISITAKMPVISATFLRHRQGHDAVAPRADLGFTQNFLYCLNGEVPSDEAVDAVDMYLVLLADHGLNASTFAAMVTVGTNSDMYSAVTTGIGALKGPLHGGANRAAMEMLERIPSSADAKAFVDDTLANKRRIMGFGHRVYTTKDPRGTLLYEVAEKLLKATGQDDLLKTCQIIEKEMADQKGLSYNVDFYSAPVLKLTGFPTDAFVDVFAISRVVGWTAHVIEYMRDPALLRPRAQYVGPMEAKWVPIEERG